ncbi:hypothetical protein ACKTEK_03210 [Tepidamorphus sp. 3E244]|uniref:hypothetical protein n=1 Tax=Tepidamorphus sp. 3E244 TaxID=3385498 RepID=UPI0038FC2F8D
MTTDSLSDDAAAGSSPPGGDSLAALWRALTHQAARFEARMSAKPGEDDAPPDAATAEKDARTLSVLVRAYESLRDLTAEQAGGEGGNSKEADGGGPDIEALRRELAERLGRLCANRAGGADAGPAECSRP